MRVRHLVTGLAAVVSQMSCASTGISAPPGGLPHAAATSACAPNDGPAVAIYLAPGPVELPGPPTPHVRVHIWQPLDRLTERPWTVAGDRSEAGAWYHSSAGDFVIATGGRVTVTDVGPGDTVEGSVDLRFPGVGTVRGGFRAAWLTRSEPILCG